MSLMGSPRDSTRRGRPARPASDTRVDLDPTTPERIVPGRPRDGEIGVFPVRLIVGGRRPPGPGPSPLVLLRFW